MSTLEFVSTSADGISESGSPLVSAPALMSGLGTHPSITIPLVGGRQPDIDALWQWLAEPADFFGIPVPDAAALGSAVACFAREIEDRHGHAVSATTIVAVEIDGRPQFAVSGTLIEPVRRDPVVLAAEAVEPAPPALPYWRQMAARTSSHAEDDLAERDLNAAGFADSVAVDGHRIGVARLGALVFDTADGRIGTGSARLGLLRAAGLVGELTMSDEPVDISGPSRVWWVSPRFETHPVAAIGERRFDRSGVGHE